MEFGQMDGAEHEILDKYYLLALFHSLNSFINISRSAITGSRMCDIRYLGCALHLPSNII